MTPGQRPKVLFVCLGNICRSPSAETVFRTRAEQAGLDVFTDSAGTGNWHVGRPPDARAIAAAARRGLDMSALRARQVCASDFTRFTHVFAMDRQNLADLEALRPPGGVQPRLFLPCWKGAPVDEVPDPYYGGEAGFEQMFDLIERASEGLVEMLAGGDDPAF